MEDNERWLSDGNCRKCRRQNYCKKTCKPAERRQMNRTLQIGYEVLSKYLGGSK